MCPPSFPPKAPYPGPPLPSAGSPGAGFPDIAGTTSGLRLLAARPAALLHARRYHGLALFAPAGVGSPRGPDVFYGGRPRAASPVETARPPRFLGDPSPACPALRPRWNRRRPASLGAVDGAFRRRHGVGFHDQNDFGARSRGLQGFLCTLRSRGRPRTTQHSVPAGWPALAGQVFHLLGRIEGFRHVSSCTSPFTKLCLAQDVHVRIPD